MAERNLGLLDEDRQEKETRRRLLGFPDHSEGGEATKLLVEMDEVEVGPLLFYFDKSIRAPGPAATSMERFAFAYHKADPRRKNVEALNFMLDRVDLTERFINVFLTRARVPILGPELPPNAPPEAWEILEVGRGTQEYATDALRRMGLARERIVDPKKFAVDTKQP